VKGALAAPFGAAAPARAGQRAVAARIEQRFPGLIAEVDESVRALVGAVNVDDLARHNAGYRAYAEDPYGSLIDNEKARYLRALETVTSEAGARTVSDYGTFIPYLPVALARLGYRVQVVEKFSVYGASFRRALDQVAGRAGFEVFDLDILEDSFDVIPSADVALLMAVVEHLNGSPRALLEKVRGRLNPSGMLLFEVPNVAEGIKRLRALAGQSPLPDYTAYLDSAYPYMGHNREMTVDEVRYLLERTGYRVESLDCYDYSLARPRRLWGHLAFAIKRLLPMRHKGEAIVASARPAT
jgi:SAM-dependent methyltransferase